MITSKRFRPYQVCQAHEHCRKDSAAQTGRRSWEVTSSTHPCPNDRSRRVHCRARTVQRLLCVQGPLLEQPTTTEYEKARLPVLHVAECVPWTAKLGQAATK